MTDFEHFDDGIRTLASRLAIESLFYPLPILSIVVQADVFTEALSLIWLLYNLLPCNKRTLLACDALSVSNRVPVYFFEV